MGLFFYTKIGSIISIGDLPTTNIIEPNFNENQQVRSDAYQNRLVAGIVKGIQKYYAGQ